METIDYSKPENQIGCGYCKEEKICKIRDPKINKAKYFLDVTKFKTPRLVLNQYKPIILSMATIDQNTVKKVICMLFTIFW